MDSNDIKRLLLAMGVRAPHLKLALRDIMDYLEDNGDDILRPVQASLRTAAPEKYDHIDFKPPKSVADAAEKGLEYRRKQEGDKAGLTPEEAGDKGIGSGVQRATNLKNRDELQPDTINQMVAFFARHEKNKDIDAEHEGTPWEDNGYVSHLLWGGDPGKRWAEKVQKQMEDADKKDKKSYLIARKVAARHMEAYLPNLGNSLLESIKDGLTSFARQGLAPFPSSSPGRILSKLASKVVQEAQKDMPSGYSLGQKEAFDFLTYLLQTMEVLLTDSDVQDAAEMVLAGAEIRGGAGKVSAGIEMMLQELAQSAGGGQLRSQDKLVRILQRLTGAEEYEALQMLDHIISRVEFRLPMHADQINGLLSGYLSVVAKTGTTEDLPTIMEYFTGDRYSRKNRLQREKKALFNYWVAGRGDDVPRRLIKEATDLIVGISGDMGPEWADEGYTQKQIDTAAKELARDMRPDLAPALFWRELSYGHKTWRDMPDRF